HPRVAEFSGTSGDPFAERCATQPPSQNATSTHDPQSASPPNFPVIDDVGRLRSRPDCGNAGAGRMDRWWSARRSGKTGTKTNHTASQNEKIRNLETHFSRGNRRARRPDVLA